MSNLIYILCCHWFCDFVLQTRWQGNNKSKSIKALLSHTTTYSVVMCVLLQPILGLNSLCFAGITFIAHTFTDYFTSKLNAWLWINKKEHTFWVSLGFDQFLHNLQLLLTYNLFI